MKIKRKLDAEGKTKLNMTKNPVNRGKYMHNSSLKILKYVRKKEQQKKR